MRTRSIGFNLFWTIAIPVAVLSLSTLAMTQFVLNELTASVLVEAQEAGMEKYRLELQSATDLAVSLASAVMNDDSLSPEQRRTELRRVIRPLRFGSEGYFYAYEAGTGVNLVHGATPDLEGRSLWDLTSPDGSQYIIRELDQVAADGSTFLSFFWSKPGEEEPQPKLGTAAMVPGTDLWLGTGEYVDRIQDDLLALEGRLATQIRGFKAAILLDVLILFALVLLLLRVITRSLSKPIVALRDVLVESNGTDFSARPTYVGRLRSRELEELYDEVNRIFDAFSSVVTTSSQGVSSTKELGRRLSEISARSKRNVEAIHSSVAHVVDEMTSLAGNVGESAESSRALKGFVDEVEQMVADQVAAMEESSAAVEQILQSIGGEAQRSQARKETADALLETSQAGEREINTSVKTIQEITASLDGIEQAISLIGDVASRTNLLAMNAAIEAAHAGSAGTGFAVIAMEIRKLSEDTSRNARAIGESLEQIAGRIRRSEESVSTSGRYFGRMLQGVGEVNEGLTSSQDAIHEIAAGGRQVSEALASVRRQSHHVADASREVKTRLEAINATFHEADRVASATQHRLHESADQLTSVVAEISELHATGEENEARINEVDTTLSAYRV